MKNLKRVLSLALTTVMLLGMMVVGANAAFADQGSIKYPEAVDMLTGLGVINGMENNTFQPKGTLTRAQAAKLVAFVKAGANENTVGYYDGSTKFTDVKSNHAWAQGSINYCVANGIVSGVGAKTFAPDANLTGAQLAKMLLVALGYPETSEKDTETLTGPNWQVNTLRKATQAGLFKDLDSDFVAVKNVTREEASQIIYNALYADVVEVRNWDMYGNPNYQVIAGKKLITTCFDLVEVKGTVTGNAATGAPGTKTTGVDAAAGISASSVYALKTGLDMIGHNVTVLVKTDNKGKAVLNNDQQVIVYGIVDNASLAVSYVSSGKGVETDLKTAGFAKGTGDAYKNGKTIGSGYASLSAGGTVTDSDKGVKMVAISNSVDMTVDYIFQVDSYLNKVVGIKTVGTGKDAKTTYTFAETAGAENKTRDNTQVNVYDGIAKDDYVIITKTGTTFYNVEKVSAVNSNVSRLNKAGSNLLSVVAGGTTYTKSGVDADTLAGNAANKVSTFANTATGSCILLVDGDGKLIATAEGAKAVNFAYVAAIAMEKGYDENNMLTDNMPKAMVYFADGTKGAYFVDTAKSDTDGDTTDNGAEFVEGFKGLYNVVLSGSKVIITSAAGEAKNSAATATWTITKGVSKVGSATKVYTDSNTVAFFVKGTYGQTGFSVTLQKGTAGISSVVASKVAGAQLTAAAADPAGNQFISAMVVSDAPSDSKIDVVYYNGAFAVEPIEGTTDKTVYFTVYKDGVEQVVSYKNGNTAATAGFYKTGATDLTGGLTEATSSAVNDKIATAVTPTAFVGGTLTTDKGDYQITGSTVVVDLASEPGAPALDIDAILDDDTMIVANSRVAISFTEDPVTHVRTAVAVYITAAEAKPAA